MEREGELHMRALASPGLALLHVTVFVFGCLAFKFLSYGRLIGFLIVRNRSRLEVVGSPIYSTYGPPPKYILIELGFCLFSLLRRLHSLLHPKRQHALMNERAGLWNHSLL